MIRLAAFYFAYYLALGGYVPYFAPFLEAQSVEAWQISVIMSLWYGTRIFAPSAWAALSMRAGHPNDWLRAGCVLTLGSFALFLLPLPFAGLVLVMALFATLYNAVLPQFEALTLERLGAQRSRYARIRLWGSIGFLLANLGYGACLRAQGYSALIWALLPAFGLLVCAAWAAPRAVTPPERTPTVAAASAPPSRLRPATRRLLLIALLMQICHGPFYIYLSLFLAENGWDSSQIGQFWALGVLAEVLLFFCMPALLARFAARTLLVACLLAGALRWPVLALWPDLGLVVAGTQLLHALTFAAFHSVLMQGISHDCRGAELRRVQALLYGLSSGVGGVLGAWLAGAVWIWVGHAQAFVLAGVLSALTVLLLFHPRQGLQPEVRHAA